MPVFPGSTITSEVLPDATKELEGPSPPKDAKPEDLARFRELQKWHDGVMEDYRIDPGRMNDPFMPIETVARPPEVDQTQLEAQRRKNLPMIQRLALNQFTLEAIIVANDPSNSTALVNSGGFGYLIRVGTKIGPNNGFVKEITPNKVIIEEAEVNYRGERNIRVTELSLNSIDAGVTDYIG
jgi:Tfp pilus assembly protein PilP